MPKKASDLQNDVGYLTQHQDISGKANISDLAVVATSGSYNDLSNKPTIPTAVSDLTNDSNFTTKSYVDGEISDLQTTISTKADIDGSYDSMAVKESERLASLDFTEDNTPYLFRKSGGDGNEEPVIVGGSVVWNQYAKVSSMSWPAAGYNGIYVTKVDDETVHVSGTATANAQARAYFFPKASSLKNHVCYVKSGNSNVMVYLGNMSSNYAEQIGKPTTSPDALTFYIPNGTDFGENGIDIKPKIVDLTAMLGTAITDYIMTITPMANRVAWLKRYFMLDKHYPYTEPTLKHVEGLAAHKMVGFNQWDEVWEIGGINSSGENESGFNRIRSKNYIPVVPSAQYYANFTDTGFAFYTRLYDADKNYIGSIPYITHPSIITMPNNAYYLRFFVYKSSWSSGYGTDLLININLSDQAKNGTYEPYKSYTYPLDTNVVLRGYPKLDASNNLYFDGDMYKPDGTVSRRYGVVDLGTLTWHKTSGTTPEYDFFESDSAAPIPSVAGTTDAICERYIVVDSMTSSSGANYALRITGSKTVRIRDTSYSDEATFKTSMSGVYLLYPLATPTTETADPFQSPQVVDGFGTEEWVFDDNAFPIPVGHETTYRNNIVTMQDVKDIQSNIDDIQFNLDNKQDILTFDSTPTANSTNPVTSEGIKTALDNKETAINNVEVSGVSPVIVAESNTIYNCGEVTSLSFTPCASGICDVRFTSGSTVTVLTIPNTVKFPNSFDPTSLETNTIYEINILDGIYGVVTSWAI